MKKRGFTLIELMVVVVIIGILAAIAIPNFVKIVDKAKVASVKANQHTAQVAVESMAIDLMGAYPTVEANIETEIPPNFKNPYNASDDKAAAFLVTTGSAAYTPADEAANEGRVRYVTDGAAASNDGTGYTIVGFGKNGLLTGLTLIPGK
jgi:prepilin-type N-terminal cleavage/methylation domain-containing protein